MDACAPDVCNRCITAARQATTTLGYVFPVGQRRMGDRQFRGEIVNWVRRREIMGTALRASRRLTAAALRQLCSPPV